MRRYSTTHADRPAEPITLAEAKAHMRVESSVTDDDVLHQALIQGAREWVENYCRRSLVQHTVTLKMDGFPGCIKLPYGPVLSVTSVEYIDAAGATQEVAAANYMVDTASRPGRIVPNLGFVWPVPKQGQIDAVIVTYEAGYLPGSASPTDYAANIPEALKAAIKILVAFMDRNRDNVDMVGAGVPQAVKLLLSPYEIRDFTLE